MPILHARSESADETRQIGARFGAHVSPGDIICLIGDLGAGKTHFTQGVGIGLGLPEQSVTSPTYALVAEHFGGRLPLYHMDAYRIDDPSELGPIGFDDYISRGDGVLVIEWADRIARALPDERLEIEMVVDHDQFGGADARVLIVNPLGERASTLAQRSLGEI